MVKNTLRQTWGRWCEHVDTRRGIVSWYDCELRRLRVAYDVRGTTARLMVREHNGWWTAVETQAWALVTPELAQHLAREWLDAEVAKRWPDAPTAADNRVGIRRDGRLRTVKTR